MSATFLRKQVMTNVEYAKLSQRQCHTSCLDNLAKKEYLDRHNGVAQYVHHSICNNFGVQTNAKWHTHKPQEALVLKNVEII